MSKGLLFWVVWLVVFLLMLWFTWGIWASVGLSIIFMGLIGLLGWQVFGPIVR